MVVKSGRRRLAADRTSLLEVAEICLVVQLGKHRTVLFVADNDASRRDVRKRAVRDCDEPSTCNESVRNNSKFKHKLQTTTVPVVCKEYDRVVLEVDVRQ